MKRILVGLDASPRAPAVLDAAVELAGRLDARLVLLRVYTVPVGIPLEVYVMTPDVMPEILEREARRSLEELAKRAPASSIEAIRLALGNPWQQICAMAAEEKVDLIIIGSHGYHGLDHLLGTTAARVVNHADCDVLVIHQRHAPAATS